MSRIRAVAVLAALLTATVATATGWGQPAWWALPALAAGVAISEVAVVHMSFGRQRWTFSLFEGVMAAAFVLASGAWSVVGVALGVIVAQTVRRQPPLKLWFNVSQFSAGAALGAALSTSLGGGVTGAMAGMGLFWFVNNAMVALAVSFATGQKVLAVFRASAFLAAVHATGTTSMGLLAAWLSFNAPLGLLGLLVPMILLWSSYDEQTARAAEARLFAELARGQEQALQKSADAAAQVVLTAAARLFGGADVEMLLLDADGPVRYVGDEFGVGERRRVDTDTFDEPWVLRALGSRGVTTGVDQGRPYCSAILGEPGAPLAVLVARRAEGASAFGRREATLAGVLVQQAESWLSVAALTESRDEAVEAAAAADQTARALGDLGAHTAPALGVLRESAARLTRLATDPNGRDPVGDIVEELHAVERAVASLLGAIALAADPELARGDLGSGAIVETPAPAARVQEDWTTTGVLDQVSGRT